MLEGGVCPLPADRLAQAARLQTTRTPKRYPAAPLEPPPPPRRPTSSAAPLPPPQASFNLLKALPESLGGLASLELLRVASCEIREVPASLAALHRLAWLSLSGNPAGQAASPRKLAPPEVPISDLTLHEKLGDGASGEVFRATWAGQAVAVKLFRGDRSPDGHSRDEIALACAVNDRHLAKVLARLAQPLGLVMELFEGAPLAEKPNHEVGRWAGAGRLRVSILRVGSAWGPLLPLPPSTGAGS